MLLSIVIFLILPRIGLSFTCWQCGGAFFGNSSVRLSRDGCCRARPVRCRSDQICIRAVVVSEHDRFFISGCHEQEDGLIGCDSHSLSHNATIYRCACADERCQQFFPGTCATTTRRPPTTTPPRRRLVAPTPWPATVARLDTNRPEVQGGLTASASVAVLCLPIMLLAISYL